jgi:uncharacterized repeat protein (TIGR04138 family)
MKRDLDDIANADGRYSAAAFRFVYEGLEYTVKNVVEERGHVSGQTLCEGLRRMALDRYGRLALLVLRTWRIKTTRDFGEIVYALIEHEWMSAQPTDTIDDFNGVYDFQAVFGGPFPF